MKLVLSKPCQIFSILLLLFSSLSIAESEVELEVKTVKQEAEQASHSSLIEAKNKPEESQSSNAARSIIDTLLDDFNFLKTYIKRYGTMVGEQRLLLKLKTSELLKRQVGFIEQLLEFKRENKSISEADLIRLRSLLTQELELSNASFSVMIKKRDLLRTQYEAASVEQSLSLELQMVEKEKSLNEIMTLQLRLIDWLGQFSVDNKDYESHFEKQLLARAKELSLLISYANTQIELLVNKRLEASEQEIAQIDLNLRRLALKQESSVSSLELLVSMMDDLKVNSDAYKEILITSTGAVSKDIFEVKVLTRLLKRWTETLVSWFGENAITMAVKIIVFFLIILSFAFISKVIRKLVRKTVNNSKLNLSKLLQDFFISMVGKAVFFIGLMIALSQLGVELAPLLAGFGIAGIVIGFALQGTLSNFASGLMILIYRPFDVGDMIIAGGIQGIVKKLSLVNATIQTIDNRRVVVPNNMIWDDVITNISAETLRRVDLVFGIGYGDNIEFAEKVLMDEVDKHPMILNKPEPIVKLANLGESSVDFWVRPWVKNEHYWDVYWDLTRAVKLRFDKEGISIPFPQRDVHVYASGQNAVIE